MRTIETLVVQDEYAELMRHGAIAQDQPIELVDGPRLGLHLFHPPRHRRSIAMKLRNLAAGTVAAVALTLTASCGVASNDAATSSGAAASSELAASGLCAELLASPQDDLIAAAKAATMEALTQPCPAYWSSKCKELTALGAELATATALPPGLSSARRAINEEHRAAACSKAEAPK